MNHSCPASIRIGRTFATLFLTLLTVTTTLAQDVDADAKADKPLPTLAEAIASDQARLAAGEKPAKTVVDEFIETYVGPDEIAREAFLPPPDAKRLSKQSNLWVNRRLRRVYVDGYVAMREGALEMFACPAGTKEHESVVAVLAKSREVHAGLLAVDAVSGKPVRFLPEFVPPSGQAIRVWVCWRDAKGKFHKIDARKWIQNLKTEKEMTAEWVFAGSGFWKDPSDNREYYRADSGDMICVSNFSTAMMDVNISSSAEADELLYVPFTDRIPERGTPVRLVLVPIPESSDSAKTPKLDPNQAPTEEVLPVNKNAKKPKPAEDTDDEAAVEKP